MKCRILVAAFWLIPAWGATEWGPYRGANTSPMITEDDVRAFAATGGNLLRISFTRPLMDKQPPYSFNEDMIGRLDRLLDACEKYKVYAVIDPHTTPGTVRNTTVLPTDEFMKDFSWHEHLIRLWDRLARRYKDRGAVIAGYDLLNEPSLPNGGPAETPADWNLLVRKLIKTIRAVDRMHTIIIEPPTIVTAEGKRINRLEAMSYLVPPQDPNVVYSPHMYEPHQFTHQGVEKRPEPVPYPSVIEGKRWDRAELARTLQPVVQFQKKYGATIFMGEFSAPRWRGDDANRYLRDVIEICEQNGWSWAYHAWREWEGWDPERSNFDRNDRERRSETPRLTLLRQFFARNANPAARTLPDREIWLQWPDFSGKVAVSAARIDVSRQIAGPISPVPSDYRVGMWYFPGWYANSRAWGGLARLTPWRMPLLFDSADERVRHSGVSYYADGDPRVMDWHIKWMAEHAINWIMVDWYPQFYPDGRLNPSSPLNSALDVGFLGKDKPGGAPVSGNRFEKIMEFAVMWTNHAPFDQLAPDLGEYFARHYFKQPNYFKIDGKPLVGVWSVMGLVQKAGSIERARQELTRLREAAKREGIPEIYIAAISQPNPRPLPKLLENIRALGFDGAMGYWNFGTDWEQQTKSPMAIGGKTITVHWEDYPTQTVPGTERGWEEWRKELGREYIVPTTPMQDWRGLSRDRVIVMSRVSPGAFEDMLSRARRHIEAKGLRRIITIEAWDEWNEGSYVEPSIEYGFGWLEAIRRVFAKPEAAVGPVAGR